MVRVVYLDGESCHRWIGGDTAMDRCRYRLARLLDLEPCEVCMSEISKSQPITDAALAELDIDYVSIKNVKFGGIGGKIVDSYPALRERLRMAEAEKEGDR